MVYSRKKKYLFLHPQKTAGTSVSKALIEIDPTAKQTPDKHYTLEKLLIQKRNPMTQDDDLSEYFKFMTVRNPWDRMVSYYLYEQQYKGKHLERSFEDWLSNSPDKRRVGWTATGKWCVTDYPQTFFGKNLEKKFVMDYVIRFDNLIEDFKVVCKKIGLNYGGMPQELPTRRWEYQAYYNDNTKELVRRAFKEDIDRFGYEF